MANVPVFAVHILSLLQIQFFANSIAPFLMFQNQWSHPVRAAGDSVGLAASRAPAGAADLGRSVQKNVTPAIAHFNGKCPFINDFPIYFIFHFLHGGLFHRDD